jgi:acyl-homoserine-lactone acylase
MILCGWAVGVGPSGRTPTPAAATRTAQVEILRDAWGIPHIYGETAEDVMYGFGYAQAEDHLEEMSSFLLEAEGRLSQTFVGDDPTTPGVDGREALLAADLIHRLFEIRSAVDRRWDALDALDDPAWGFKTRALAQAFAAGVNAYVEAHQDRVPAWVPRWTGQGVLALGRQQGLLNALKVLASKGARLDVPFPSRALRLLPRGAPPFEPASNQFAVGPARNDNGSVRVLASPHLPFYGHTQWYFSQLVGGGFDSFGGGFFGFPGQAMMVSPFVAFSETNNMADNADFFAMRLDPTDTRRYLRDGESVPFEVRRQTVTLADGSAHTFTLVYVEQGGFRCPVVRPAGTADFTGQEQVIAACTATLDDVHLITQFWRMMRARSVSELLAIIAMRAVDKWNFVGGDREGHIFYVCNSRHPRRADPAQANQLIDGSHAANDWQGILSFEELPQAVDPEIGFVQNCNSSPAWITPTENSPLDMRTFPPDLCQAGLGARAELMLQRLSEKPVFSFEDLNAIAHDDFVLVASRWVPLILQGYEAYKNSPQIDDPRLLAEAVRVLEDWTDYRASVDNRALALFSDWFIQTHRSERPPQHISQSEAIAGLNALAESARRVKALFGRVDPRWGEVHRIRRGEFEAGVSGTDKALQALHLTSVGSYAGGVGYTVSGSSMHIVMELGPEGVRAAGYKPWGESADPASPHYADITREYAKNEHIAFWLTRAQVEAHLESRTVLRWRR